ncbi:MAG: hypothetical protein UW01_C0001G0153, partial [Candidatus Nomurabacteria bacterium GW2011_GWA2_43_66]
LGCFLFVLFFEKIVKNARLKGGEGSPNGMALVSKTSGSNPLQVQVLYPPQICIVLKYCYN